MATSSHGSALPGAGRGTNHSLPGVGEIGCRQPPSADLPARRCRTGGGCSSLAARFAAEKRVSLFLCPPFLPSLRLLLRAPPPPRGRRREWGGRAEGAAAEPPVCQCVCPSLLHCLPSPLPRLPCPPRTAQPPDRCGGRAGGRAPLAAGPPRPAESAAAAGRERRLSPAAPLPGRAASAGCGGAAPGGRGAGPVRGGHRGTGRAPRRRCPGARGGSPPCAGLRAPAGLASPAAAGGAASLALGGRGGRLGACCGRGGVRWKPRGPRGRRRWVCWREGGGAGRLPRLGSPGARRPFLPRGPLSFLPFYGIGLRGVFLQAGKAVYSAKAAE